MIPPSAKFCGDCANAQLTCLIQRIAAIGKPQLYNAFNSRIDPVSRPPCPPDRREFRYVRTVWAPKIPAVRLSCHERKKVAAAFDGGRITSDGGVLLLGAVERQLVSPIRLRR